MTKRLIAIAALSYCLLAIGISNVRVQLGDEHRYIGAAKDFIAAAPSTNPEHPPLDKYLIAWSIHAFGDNPFGWRFPCVLAGVLLALCTFGVTYQLTKDWHTAYLAWVFSIAGGFWYEMSRFVSLSIFELAFEMAAIWLFLAAMESASLQGWCYAGVLFGLSVASRWLGAMGLATCLAIAFAGRRFYKPCFMGFVSAVTYFTTWIPLLIREHRPLGYLITANAFILRFHSAPNMGTINSEYWVTWPFLMHSVRSSPFIANPVVGILGLVAVILALRNPGKRTALPALLYAAHMLPWIWGVRAATYYYYYFESYTFSAIALAVAVPGVSVARVRLEVPVVAAAVGYFVYWYPAWGFFPPPFGGIFGYH